MACPEVAFAFTSRVYNHYSPMSKYTAFRCPEDILAAAKIKAKADRRSLSNYIITLLEDAVGDELERVRRNPALKPKTVAKSAKKGR